MPGSDNAIAQRAARIEVVTWVLIYGGLAGAGLGLFVDQQPDGAMLGGLLMVGGLVAVAIGIVLIVVRSRMPDAPASKAKR